MWRHQVMVGRLLLFCGLIHATGCSPVKPDPDADAFARRAIAMVQHGDSAALSKIIDQSLNSRTQWTNLQALRDTLQVFNPDTLELVGFQALTMDERSSITLSYQLHGTTRWGVVTIPLDRRGRGFVVMGLNLEPLPSSVQDLNAFTLSARTWRHYLILTLALVSVFVSVGSAILIARTPMPRRWLWAFIALLGLGQIGIDWTSGDVFVNFLRLQLLGAGFVRPGSVGPWIISFSLPVGAVWALWHHRRITHSGASGSRSGDAA
jgi:hypothetical protein